MNSVDSLARFRADPSKVRVSIRRDGDRWVATVSSRSSRADSRCFHADPIVATKTALRGADSHIPGIDLGMEHAYEHPFGRVGLEARR